jgi:DNA polymerase-3 subunit delta
VALEDGAADFNMDSFYGQSIEGSRIRDVAETLPMMARYRVVIVKEAQDLTERDFEELVPLIEQPVSSTVLIFVCSKIDKRKRFFKSLLKGSINIEFKRPYENQIPSWINYIAQKHGLQIDPDEVVLIHDMAGSNLQDLNGEIKKLAQYLGERKHVEPQDILQVVSRLRADSVFDLTNAIGNNDRARALVCLANLLDHGENEVGVLALISRHVRILKGVRDGLDEGLSGAKLSGRVGVPPYFLKDYMEQTRYWPQPKLERTVQALLDTDKAIKSSPVSAHIWLENFILRTCHG